MSSARIPAPARVSFCKLDIDIRKNEPTVLVHTSEENRDRWLGTEISVVISGAWSAYRSRIMHYFQQLAVITPYASLRLEYANVSGGAGAGRGDFSYEWRRRSLQIPKPPAEVKHHPAAVNDLLVQQLAGAALAQRGGAAAAVSLLGFLTGQFQCVEKAAAAALIDDLGRGFAPGTPLGELTPLQFHQLTRALVTADFPPPSARCLSPAGEYNLRLGIMKEVRPDMVATFTAPVGVFEGHPFIVEAGVALGGEAPEGLTVYRFANRIPLLFEGGSDVATRTAATRIAWGSYKIDPGRDRVGVFVSLVSTKVPFKGTGKEYIGDDILEIRDAVRAAIMACCGQLRVKLLRAAAVRARADRRKNLLRYVPDVVRALRGAFKGMNERRKRGRADGGGGGRGRRWRGRKRAAAAAAAAAARQRATRMRKSGAASWLACAPSSPRAASPRRASPRGCTRRWKRRTWTRRWSTRWRPRRGCWAARAATARRTAPRAGGPCFLRPRAWPRSRARQRCMQRRPCGSFCRACYREQRGKLVRACCCCARPASPPPPQLRPLEPPRDITQAR